MRYRSLSFVLGALLTAGCASGSADSEPAPAPAVDPTTVATQPDSAETPTEDRPHAPPPEEPQPSDLELGRMAMGQGLVSEGLRFYEQVLGDETQTDDVRAEASYHSALARLALNPVEENIERAKNRLQRVRARGYKPLEVSATLSLLAEMEKKDETIRRLTEAMRRRGPDLD